MLKLLIADDEKTIRESIHSLIRWEDYDIQVIGTAQNGIEAYHMILDQYPDIVLTDIKMPGLTGLDLIEKIRAINQDTQFIILSGFDEFKYAQAAMQYGIKHYLLKPCNEEQILKAIEEIKLELQKKLPPTSSLDDQMVLKKQINTSIMIHLFQTYLMQDFSNDEKTKNYNFSEYEQYLLSSDISYQLYYLYFVEEANFKSILEKIQQFWNSLYPGIEFYCIYVRNSLLLFFPFFQYDNSTLENYFLNLHKGRQNIEIQLEQKLFKNLDCMFSQISKQLQRYEVIQLYNKDGMVTINNSHMILKVIQNLTTEYMLGDISHRPQLQEQLLQNINTILDFTFLKQVTTNILTIIVSYSQATSLVNTANIFTKLKEIEDLDTYKKEFLLHLNTFFAEKKEDSTSLSSRIKQYVNINLQNPDLSLKWLAENELYMNVDYLSKCFVKETNQKFSTYLTETRMNKAKELMLSLPQDKVQNIAELIGCGNNPLYFSQIFKKYNGMTPSQYMKSIQKS